MGVDEAVGSTADAQLLKSLMEEGQLRFRQCVGNVPQLIRIDAHVVVSDESSDKLAVKRVVRRIERTHTPVRVVVSIHAHTEWAILP